MKNEDIKKNYTSKFQKESKRSKLNRLTDENDLLIKNLKKPGGLYKAA